jgi:hypothetical protein
MTDLPTEAEVRELVESLVFEAITYAYTPGSSSRSAHAALLSAIAKLAQRAQENQKDAERLNFLRHGGWEVLQDPRYWTVTNKFDGVIDEAMRDVALASSTRVSDADGIAVMSRKYYAEKP